MNKRYQEKITFFFFYLLLWQVISLLVAKEYLLPGPLLVFRELVGLLSSRAFLVRILHTLTSWFLCLLVSLLLGGILSLYASRYSFVGALLSGPLHFMRAAPVVAYILLFLIWFERQHLAFIVGFFMAFPIIYENMLQGWLAVPAPLLEMAESFQVGKKQQYQKIYWPSMKTYLEAGLSIAGGLLMKAIIAVEVLGFLPDTLGEALYYSKLYLNLAELMAITMIIVLLSLVSDRLIKKIFGGSHDSSQ